MKGARKFPIGKWMVRAGGGAGSGHGPLGCFRRVEDSGTRAEAHHDRLSRGYFHELRTAMTERTRIPQQSSSTRSITEKQRIARCAREASRKRRLVGSDDAVTFILI